MAVVRALVICMVLGPAGAGCGPGGPAASPSASPGTLALPGYSGSSPSAAPAGRAAASLPAAPAHTVIVIMENHAYGQVIGSPEATYINRLASIGALFTDSRAVTHPSQPNYLALFSGSTQRLTDDSCPNRFSTGNLAAELIGAGKTFAGYSEDLPATGSFVCTSGGYARKHVPWINFSNVPATDSRQFARFPAGGPSAAIPDADFARLPALSFVIPSLCDDMHDCPVATGDTWLRTHLGAYAAWAMRHHSLLIVTWDENDDRPGNQIATIFAGQMVRHGRFRQPVTHYSVLRTIEALYRLPYVGHARSAQTITAIWTANPAARPR